MAVFWPLTLWSLQRQPAWCGGESLPLTLRSQWQRATVLTLTSQVFHFPKPRIPISWIVPTKGIKIGELKARKQSEIKSFSCFLSNIRYLLAAHREPTHQCYNWCLGRGEVDTKSLIRFLRVVSTLFVFNTLYSGSGQRFNHSSVCPSAKYWWSWLVYNILNQWLW